MMMSYAVRFDKAEIFDTISLANQRQYRLETKIGQMLKVCILRKATPIDTGSDFTKVDG